MGDKKLGWSAAFASALAGMVGAGIFSAIGVSYVRAGALSWLAFLIGGFIAAGAAFSYSRLAAHYRVSGGTFGFLEAAGRRTASGNYLWLALLGYALLMAVYASTAGLYAARLLGASQMAATAVAVALVAAVALVDLRHSSAAGRLDTLILPIALLALGIIVVPGLAQLTPADLVPQEGRLDLVGLAVGIAAGFMAYEGFELVAHRYDQLRRGERTLLASTVAAVAAATTVFTVVSLSVGAILGAETVAAHPDTALADAAHAVGGVPAEVAISVAALLGAAAAVNATLTSAAVLAGKGAGQGQLPAAAARVRHGVPYVAMMALAAVSVGFALSGNRDRLVEVASLVFLAAYTSAGLLAARQRLPGWQLSALVALVSLAAAVVLVVHLAVQRPATLGFLVITVAVVTAARPRLVRRWRRRPAPEGSTGTVASTEPARHP